MAKPAVSPAASKGRVSSPRRGGSIVAPAGGKDGGRKAPGPQDAEVLPTREETAALAAPVRAFMGSTRQARVRDFLRRLAQRPPQVILLEGGTAEERTAAAMFWALLLNCSPGDGKNVGSPVQNPQASLFTAPSPAPQGNSGSDRNSGQDGAVEEALLPCLECSACLRIIARMHRDFFFLDGLAGSIKLGDPGRPEPGTVRAVRGILGEPPREARFRVVVFREAQALVEPAANALLKSFEEPRPATSFVLLVPQRERLLPTLVSRSFTLTLPWPDAGDQDEGSGTPRFPGGGVFAGTGGRPVPMADDPLASWEADLCRFLKSGQGWLERTGVKGAVDAALAHAVLNLCRRALVARLLSLQHRVAPKEGLESLLARLPEQRLRMFDEVLAECQDSLVYAVNPSLVLEWLATRLYLLLR